MHTELITMPKAEAETLYRKYKSHVHYDKPEQSIDAEIRRTYQLIAQGKTIIRAIESIKQAGLNREFLPKLAIGPATAKECHIRRNKDGSMVMGPSADFFRDRKTHIRFADETFVFPAESFPMSWDGKFRINRSQHKAATPVIPMHLRPKRGLANYHILLGSGMEADAADRPILAAPDREGRPVACHGRLGPDRGRARSYVNTHLSPSGV